MTEAADARPLTLAAFHALPFFKTTTPRRVILGERSWSLPAQRREDERGPVMSTQLRWTAPPLEVRVTAVLLSGAIGDYTAYVGVGDAAWVGEHGNKVPFPVAALMFPGIEQGRYRT